MKKHKFKILTFVAVAAALSGTGCFKSIGYETFYVLRPWAQEGTVKTPIPREDMLAYAFDADPNAWSVLSYEDAVAGIITSRRTGEKLQPIAQGEPYEIDGNENWLAMQLNGPRFLILAVDLSNRLYGFTEQAIGENLPQMHVSVTFYPKEKGRRFLKGKWIMCNDFYTEPEPEPDPDPENPDTPDNPDNPNNPGTEDPNPDDPGTPDDPDTPDTPAPDDPDTPANPDTPENPDVPDNPNPVTPDEPAVSGARSSLFR